MTLLSFSRQGSAWYAYVKRFGYARQSSGLCDSCSLDLATNTASDAFSPPPSQTSQDALYSSSGNQKVNKEALDADSTEESLKDILNNFFEDIELLNDLSPFSFYLRPPQLSARLRRYIIQYSYTEERERHYSNLMNIYEGICLESSECR